MVSPTTSPARSHARVQYVGFQFGKGSGMHFRFASAARECLVMKERHSRSLFAPIRFASKPGMGRHDQRSHTLDLARSGATDSGTHRAKVQLRMEDVVSFADACCAKHSNCLIVAQRDLHPVSYAYWLYQAQKDSLSQRTSAARNLRYEPAQESTEDPQISPRKPSRSSGNFKDATSNLINRSNHLCHSINL